MKSSRARRWALAALLVLLMVAAGVQAHPAYLTSDPPHGAQLDVAPTRVNVTLSESMEQGAKFRVTGPGGEQVDDGNVMANYTTKPTLTVGLQGNLSEGVYTATWEILSSEDGHAIVDSFQFAIGSFAIGEREAASGNPDPGLVVAKALLYAGFALGLGGGVFLLWMRGDPRMATHCAKSVFGGAVLHLAGVALLWVATQESSGLSAGSFAATETGRLLYARLVIGAAALSVVAFWFLRTQEGQLAPAVTTGLLALGALLAARLGHARAEGPVVVATDFVHLVAASVWVGGLFLLVVTLLRPATPEEARRFGLRFSTLALLCVTVLVGTGVVSAVSIVGTTVLLDWETFLATAYGKALAGKVALVVLMLAAGVLHRFLFLAKAKAATHGAKPVLPDLKAPIRDNEKAPALGPIDSPRRVGLFARIVAAETTFGLLAILLAATLTSAAPPEDPAQGFDVSGESGGAAFKATFTPKPFAPGSSEVILEIWELRRTPDGQARLDLPADTCGRACLVEVTFTTPAGGLMTQEAVADGRLWRLPRAMLWAEPGTYEILVHVHTTYVLPTEAVERFEVQG